MTLFENACQSPTEMALTISFCMAEFIEQMGIVDFFTYERKQFMAEVAQVIELWLKGKLCNKNDKNGGENADE